MKKTIALMIALYATASSCKKVEKDPLAYYPKVKTVSAVVLDDGTVQVTGELLDEGTSDLTYTGFCMDTVNDPYLMKNQVITAINGNTFIAIYENFDINATYYFRSWATNDYGYTYGNTISLDSITSVPVVAPCTVTPNTTNYSSGTETFINVTGPVQNLDEWTITAVTNAGSEFSIIFGDKPKTKKYITSDNVSPGYNAVQIYFNSGFIFGTINQGSDFYVNQTGFNTWEMTLCPSPWTYQFSTLTIRMNLTCPL